MNVILYQPRDIEEPREIVDSIRARRGGTLLNLDRMLLHSPPLAGGWNSLLRAVRSELEVAPRLRELAICAVAILNGADYEYRQHSPLFLKAGGTASQLDALTGIREAGADASVFDTRECAVIELTVEMTQTVRVESATLAAVQAALENDRQVVEIVAVIATYNMVSRFLVALGVEPE